MILKSRGLNSVHSSYKQNQYGFVFRSIIRAYKPMRAVELGVLDGYSTYHIGVGLKEYGGRLQSYDLFEDYPYRHSDYEHIKHFFKDCSNVELIKGDAFEAHKNYENRSIDFLHVDLSNTGDIVKRIIEDWDSKIVYGGLILIEGGTEERDTIDWMIKYKKPSIKRELETNEIIRNNYVFGTYLKFPGLTTLLKKR